MHRWSWSWCELSGKKSSGWFDYCFVFSEADPSRMHEAMISINYSVREVFLRMRPRERILTGKEVGHKSWPTEINKPFDWAFKSVILVIACRLLDNGLQQIIRLVQSRNYWFLEICIEVNQNVLRDSEQGAIIFDIFLFNRKQFLHHTRIFVYIGLYYTYYCEPLY